LERQDFLRYGLTGGALVVAGTALSAAIAAEDASAAPTEVDFAYAQFGVASEYLLADFYGKAASSKQFTGPELRALERAQFNESEHLAALGSILTGGAQPLAVADDFEFAYPKRAFTSRAAIARLGVEIETAVLGAYLTAATTVTDATFRSVFARVLASEAEHVGFLSAIAADRAFGMSFPGLLSLDQATAVTDPFFA
jgi:Ferritin-like domain